MEQVAPVIRDLARFLLAVEGRESAHANDKSQIALRVFAKLRTHLARLVGISGFQALTFRALSLAKTEVPWLEAVRVQADATLEGFSETAQQQSAEAVTEGSVALLSQLLGLLITFIGETLTLRLVGDIWPEVDGKLNPFQQFQHEGGQHE